MRWMCFVLGLLFLMAACGEGSEDVIPVPTVESYVEVHDIWNDYQVNETKANHDWKGRRLTIKVPYFDKVESDGIVVVNFDGAGFLHARFDLKDDDEVLGLVPHTGQELYLHCRVDGLFLDYSLLFNSCEREARVNPPADVRPTMVTTVDREVMQVHTVARTPLAGTPPEGTEPEYLLRLAELEIIKCHQRMVKRRVRAARFPAVKSLDTFDFLAIPSVNKVLVTELARCEYIEHRENVIAVGNSGTGKTHVALGLGLAACQRGMSVGFTTAAGLVHELMEARDERRLLNLQRQLSRLNLLIIDELGFVPLSPTGRNCSSRYSASATSGAPSWSPPTSPSTSGPRSSGLSASPERCWTGSPTTSTSWR